MRIRSTTICLVLGLTATSMAGCGPSVKSQAKDFVQQDFRSRFSECKGSFYSQHKRGKRIVELKSWKLVSVKALPVSDADRMNGIEWKAKINVNRGPYRVVEILKKSKGYTDIDTTDWEDSQLFENVALMKDGKARWSHPASTPWPFWADSSIPCDEVP